MGIIPCGSVLLRPALHCSEATKFLVDKQSKLGTFYEYFLFLMFSTSRIDLLYNHDDVGAKSREKNWVYCGSKSCFPDVLSGDLAKWLFCGRTLAAVPSLPLKCRDCAERSVWDGLHCCYLCCAMYAFRMQCLLCSVNNLYYFVQSKQCVWWICDIHCRG